MASLGILTAGLTACQSTEQESARIARQSRPQAAAGGALELGGRNRSVRVADVTLLSREGRLAVAAQLTSTTTRPQRDVPVLVTIAGHGGKTLYTNATAGIEPSLQRVAQLAGHGSAWWVDDQVLLAGTPTSTRVQVGVPAKVRAPASATPRTRGVHLSSQAGIATVAGTLVNSASRAIGKVAVFAVGLRGGHVVAAGRAVVSALAARAGASTPFQIVLVGDATGARIELSAIPSGE